MESLTSMLSNGRALNNADIERVESTFRAVGVDQQGNERFTGHHLRIELRNGAPIELVGDDADDFRSRYDDQSVRRTTR
jgi:hypothetical protein